LALKITVLEEKAALGGSPVLKLIGHQIRQE